MRRLIVEADGGSRGNPGPAAYGALVRSAASGEVLAEVAATIGTATNNVAEYRGLVAGLAAAREIDADALVEARLDSKLIVEQMSGRWKIKNTDLKPLALEARRIFPAGRVTYTWVPREKNTHADRLVNEALDGEPSRPGSPAADVPSEHADPEAADADDADGADGADGAAENVHSDHVRSGESASTRRWEAATAPRSVGTPADGGVPRLYLVRHGQTADTAARLFAGGSHAGAPLDELGHKQAQSAADLLAGSGAAAVVASPMLRAQQTAEPIAARLGVDVRIDPDWREVEFGEWEGRAIEDVVAAPNAALAWRESAAVPAPGGESILDMANRVALALDRVFETYRDQSVVVVTHSMPIRALVVAALGAPLESVHHLWPGAGSVTELQAGDSGLVLTGFNITP